MTGITLTIVQAELFRLEGLFHMALKDYDSADRAFSIALTLWPQLAAGWLSWGEFCDAKASVSLSARVSNHLHPPLPDSAIHWTHSPCAT
jgi:hypothetical protein